MTTEKKSKPRRGVYLLPNLFTTAALFAGFYAIIAALNGEFATAAQSTLAASILDSLDGRVARATNTSSAFGAEYDSMADMVSFGVAPALVLFEWSLQFSVDLGMAQHGWIAAFVFVACAGLRLARFNVHVGSADKRFFQGLPSPSAALILTNFMWAMYVLDVKGEDVVWPAMLLTVLVGLSMVSNFAYYSFKDLGSQKRSPFFSTLAILLVLAVIAIHPPVVLLSGFFLYALSGPMISLWNYWKRRKRMKSHKENSVSGD